MKTLLLFALLLLAPCALLPAQAGYSGAVVAKDGKLLSVKRTFVNQGASGTDATVVAAVTGKKIRVLALVMVTGASATNVTFGSGSTAISPLFANAANSGAVLPLNEHGWFQTASGVALTVTTGAGSTTGILVLYLEE